MVPGAGQKLFCGLEGSAPTCCSLVSHPQHAASLCSKMGPPALLGANLRGGTCPLVSPYQLPLPPLPPSPQLYCAILVLLHCCTTVCLHPPLLHDATQVHTALTHSTLPAGVLCNMCCTVPPHLLGQGQKAESGTGRGRESRGTVAAGGMEGAAAGGSPGDAC